MMTARYVLVFSLAMLGVYRAGHSARVARVPVKTALVTNDTVPHIKIPAGTIKVDEQSTTLNKIKLLDGSDLNAQDGVTPHYARLHWQGLFYHSKRFYVKPAGIKFKRIRSEFDDDDTKKTGLRIICSVKDPFVILVSAGTLLNGKVKCALSSIRLDSAGQTLNFSYQGNKYTLYTTGTTKDGRVYNYKLFLLAHAKGRWFNQLLYAGGADTAFGAYGDMSEQATIEFAGDLDGDQIPDFIITRSAYAFGNTSLYLSKPAGNKAILKLASSFTMTD